MAVRERVRLAPSVFRLPVEKIRDGYYSDAYFNLTKSLLEADGHHPRVVMQVFQRDESILGGIDEAVAILKLCAGHYEGDQWLNGWDNSRGQGAARGRRDRALGDRDDDRGRLQRVRPSGDRLPRCAGAAHTDHAQRPRGRRGGRRQTDPVLPGPPRPLAGPDRRRLVGAHRRFDRRLHRRAGLVVGRPRHRHRAARADRGLRRGHGARRAQVRRPLRARHERHRARGLRERLGQDRARGRQGARRRPVGRPAGHLRQARRRVAAAQVR